MATRSTPFIFSKCAGLALLSVSWLSACHRNASEQGLVAKDLPVHVTRAIAAERPMPQSVVLTGDLLANEESEIAANAAGQVLTTRVERGQQVKKGDVLATLDVRTASLAQKAALAQAQQASTQQQLAASECERAETLYKTASISKAEYDRQITSCTSTRFAASAAETQHAMATKVVTDGILRAPFSGTIGERYVSVGQYVMPNTRIVSLYATDPLRLSFTTPEAQATLVREGMSIAFEVVAVPGETFSGTVKFVSPNVRRLSRDLVVEAVVSNSGGKLRPGMFATVRLQLGDRPTVAVPLVAIKREGEAGRAFVVTGGRAYERMLQLGPESGGFVAILDGAKVGDVFVESPPPVLRDGSEVE